MGIYHTELSKLVSVLPTSLALMRSKPSKLPEPAIEKIIQFLSKRVVIGNSKETLAFSIVDSPNKWKDVRSLRISTYSQKLPYMCDVIGPDGTDEYDSRSVVFGCWYKSKAIATIRFSAAPFEVTRTYQEQAFFDEYPKEKLLTTLEFSRLVVSEEHDLKRVLAGLIIYTGLHIALFTDYEHYIGYTKAEVYEKLSKFKISTIGNEFEIPERGDHKYRLLVGGFKNDFDHFVNSLAGQFFLTNQLKKIFDK